MIPTGIVFITSDKAYIHPTMAIAVRILGINNVKPLAPLAKPFAAVPKTTATIKNALFVGSTAELQKMLKGKNENTKGVKQPPKETSPSN